MFGLLSELRAVAVLVNSRQHAAARPPVEAAAEIVDVDVERMRALVG
jgi:hypothetical protein